MHSFLTRVNSESVWERVPEEGAAEEGAAGKGAVRKGCQAKREENLTARGLPPAFAASDAPAFTTPASLVAL